MNTLTTFAASCAALGLLALCFVAALIETLFCGCKVLGDLDDER